jgi:choloylglycine hydrolase
MCTAATYRTNGFYFGRNLDFDFSYVEEVTVTPRKFPFHFLKMGTLDTHYAINGMAYVLDDYPLYYDGMNEKGLGMAGLMFAGNAFYPAEEVAGKDNVSPFEFIPWILSQCATVKEARVLLDRINLIAIPFRPDLPLSQLHWIIADRDEAITVESVKEGLKVYDNPAGVLTNNPPFDKQLFQLNNYVGLSPKEPENRFSSKLPLDTYSRGMGGLGLPGDLSSQSRFVRVAFVKMNSLSGDSEEDSVNQFFHILGSVEQQRGGCNVGDDKYEITLYTSCCSADTGIYYYTTYGNHQIAGVDMNKEDLDGATLARYPLVTGEHIHMQN